jgi:LuxR family maltose regulon positive regulatory protein
MRHVDAAPGFLASKLHPPRPTIQNIARPRLIELLRRFGDRPLTLVCAPAGAGKSTLLSEWFAASDIPSAWISLDERDRDLASFLVYLVAAMQQLAPGMTLDTRNLLRAPTQPPLATLAASVSNDLDQIDTPFLLVLDDYHLIANPEVDEVLVQLLRYPPRNMRLVVATRVEPPWPLAAFRARGLMANVRYADLQFTGDESGAFARKMLGDDLAEDVAAVMHEESEGWAAGLQLMALVAVQGTRPNLVGEVGPSADISKYLFNEVLALQPTHIQDRLLQLSILGRFSGSLCEAVCDRVAGEYQPEPWGRAFLSHIEQLNLFINALDTRHEFYRFHHLFRRFLAERLRDRATPEEIGALHRRASAWFAAQGLIDEAVDHALVAGDAAAAADLVAGWRRDLYDREQFARLARMLRRVPDAVKGTSPGLLLAQARIATMNWRFTEAAVFLDRAEAELAQAPQGADRTEAAGELAVLRGILDLWAGNAEILVIGQQRALELLPLDATHLRGLAHMGVAAGLWQLGDRSGAWAYTNDRLAETSPDLPVFATLLQTQAFMHWLDSNLPSLLVTGQRLLAVSEDLELPDQIALAHYFCGIALYARDELDLAREHLAVAVAARFNLRLLWWCQAAGTLALTYQALGEPALAQQVMTDARDFLLERHAVRILPNLDAFQAEINRMQGRLVDASAWAAQAEPSPLAWALTALEPRVAQARVQLARGGSTGSESAAALLAELRAFCLRVPNRRLLMEVDALGALLDDALGQRESALETVARLVLEAAPDGWVRLFADLGQPMESLLRELAARRHAPIEVARLLNAFPARPGRLALTAQTGLAEPLTERELEILELLGARESNKEIAAQLYIAPSTVKRHTLNIYRKLGVNGRREVVVRATQLGILPA